jgi:hypothetical protein
MNVNDRISGSAIEAFQQLDGDLQSHIVLFLVDNPSRQLYSREDVVRAWLFWNGILGYTPEIVRLVQQSFKE